MEIIKFYKWYRKGTMEHFKVAEIDVTGWTIRQVVDLMRAARTNGRTGKYCRL